MPAVDYTAAAFAADFPGTVGLRRSTAAALLLDIFRAMERHGFLYLAIANAHLDPAHLNSIDDAITQLGEESGIGDGSRLHIAYPNLARKPWALRMGDEFKSGACHAGRYEGSVVLARRSDLVRQELAQELPYNPASLSVAIRAGKTTFAEAGGPRAYFGDPAAASAEEGKETIAVMGAILEESVLQMIARRRSLPTQS
jgi:creatinine amidohydrolase